MGGIQKLKLVDEYCTLFVSEKVTSLTFPFYDSNLDGVLMELIAKTLAEHGPAARRKKTAKEYQRRGGET